MDTFGDTDVAAASTVNLFAVCNEDIWGGGSAPVTRTYVSNDGGVTFAQRTVLTDAVGADSVASPAPGHAVVVALAREGAGLLLTSNQGVAWSDVRKADPDSSFSELGFTSQNQGVVIETSTSADAAILLMTFDGGRHWSPAGLP